MPLPQPPRADKRQHLLERHGRRRNDPYYWLRDDNWQQVVKDPAKLNPEIRAHLEAENAYTDAVMAPTKDLQATLLAEIRGRIKEDDNSVPEPDGPYAYYIHYDDGGEHPLVCREPRTGGAREVLLDANDLAKNHEYFDLNGADHSDDHRYLAYAADYEGSEYDTIRIRDLATGVDLADEIIEVSGGVCWAKDGSFLYVKLDEHHRPSKIYRHVLGTRQSDDTLIYEEKDSAFYAGLGRSDTGDLIVISSGDHQTEESWFVDAGNPLGHLTCVAPRIVEHEYSLNDHGPWLFITTNTDGAEDFQIMRVAKDNPARENWEVVVPHEPGRLILHVETFKHFLVRMERRNALDRIVITELDDQGHLGASHEVSVDEEAYSLSILTGYEFDTTTLRFAYSSPTTPAQVFDYDMRTKERTLRKTEEIPSGHNPADYVARRIEAKASDGALVPITLLHRRDTPIDGTAPLLLYGYGSYGSSTGAGFGIGRLSLVDRGFVYAIAHVRGGQERGFGWYKAGKGPSKINTFTDFITCGETLIAEGYTAKGKIVAHGGSAGGLLVAAVANMAPELFGGIIADVPFVDLVTTLCDADLPLTPPEWTEWGNPLASETVYDHIASYSPYDNIRAQAYPAILATAGLTDPRVTYWEPAKWVAKLRDTRTDDGLTLLKTNMHAGHGGASGRFEHLKEVALIYAFALMTVGKQ